MASIELRTLKNKPAYYKITANITLNGRTIRKFSRFEFDPKTLKTASSLRKSVCWWYRMCALFLVNLHRNMEQSKTDF